MRRIIAIILVLFLAAGFASADEGQRIETALFTLEIPAGLNPDVDEFTKDDFPFLTHICHPVTIQGENDAYSLLITLYDFHADGRHRIENQQNRTQAHFDLISEYSGLTGRLAFRTVRPEGQFRDFVLGSTADGAYHLVTFYNPLRGEGYTFELRVKDGALSADEAQTLLLDIAASLREAGVIYPQITGKTLVVTHSGINVRSRPDADSAVLLVARQGDTFPYLGENGIWYMIDVGGQVGYVSKALTQVQ